MPPLIAHLKRVGVLRSPSITKALEAVDRADFTPENLRQLSYEDTALPIGGGQTISQPYTLVFMLERLQVGPGHRVLEIGYGSGWQTALLAHIAGPAGRVFAFELVPALCEQGKENLAEYPDLARRARLFCKSGENGCPEEAPFDRIIAAAEVTEVPQSWREQLKPSGRMVYPKGGALVLEVKREDGSFGVEIFPGFVFVPFVTKSRNDYGSERV